MSGRRNQSRVAFVNSGGVLRISHDVVVVKVAQDEFVAVSSQPGVLGEVLTIAFSGRDGRETETVRITTTRPVVLNGVVKHELRLERVDSDAARRDTQYGNAESGSA